MSKRKQGYSNINEQPNIPNKLISNYSLCDGEIFLIITIIATMYIG